MWKKIVLLIMLIFPIVLIGCNKKQLDINISVAASLLEPIKEIAQIYEEETNVKVNINYGGSGTLKKQISEGAEVGLFISANESFVDELIVEKLVDENQVVNNIENSLVLIKSENVYDEITSTGDLKNTTGKIAIGELKTVPAGIYAKEALENMNIWNALEERFIYCKDVSSVKTYVEKGEVDYGFIYKSDSLNLKSSKVVEVLPENSHSKIAYKMALINNYHETYKSRELMDLIISNEGKTILEKYGFEVKEEL